jgi:hypothetical protein
MRKYKGFLNKALTPKKLKKKTMLYSTRVVGVSFPNSDGTSRQKIIKKLLEGEKIFLKREPENEYDPNAIKVLTEDKKQIGYIQKELARLLAPRFDRKEKYKSEIMSIACVENEKGIDNYGIQIIIKFKEEKQ